MISRPCPICASSQYEKLHVQHFSGGLAHRIVACNSCGFVYVRETPTEKEYAKHYSQASIYEVTRDEDIHEASFNFLVSYIKKGDRILDVGCSTGNLLGLFKKNGYTRLLGIDPSPNCRIYARRKLGVTVKTATLESFKAGGKFDLVILSNVLEHLPNVKKAMEIINRLLSDKGQVYIAVPDAGNFQKFVKEPFYEFSLEHINFFSAETLRYAMAGFTPVFITSKHAELYSLWKRHTASKTSVLHYVRLSNQVTKLLDKYTHSLPSRYYAWGAGSLARRLIATTNLRPIAFIDRNPALVGQKIQRIPIMSPSSVPDATTPILIVSYRYRDEIRKEISKGFKNPVLLLP